MAVPRCVPANPAVAATGRLACGPQAWPAVVSPGRLAAADEAGDDHHGIESGRSNEVSYPAAAPSAVRCGFVGRKFIRTN
jgi:hypothetical protein